MGRGDRVCGLVGGMVMLLLLVATASARQDCQISPSSVAGSSRSAATIDANRITMWLTNFGSLGRHPETGNAGFYFPTGSDKTAIYAAGLWVAGKVNGVICTACSQYSTEFQPGVILPDGSPADPEDPRFRVYKIRPGDSADPGDPNYNPDYAEWPAEDGAPTDASGAPLVVGDQTLWWVMNDVNKDRHAQMFQSAPMNLEVQALAWAFADTTTALGQAVFVQFTLLNKGTAPIEDAYVGMWVDPDLGWASDDGTGCDTSLALTYAYNRNWWDRVYGARPPAVGVALLQGPAVHVPGEVAQQFLHAPIPNARTLGLTSNSAYY